MDAAPPLGEHLIMRAITLSILLLMPVIASADLHVVIVEGLGGNDVYKTQFADQVNELERASASVTSEDRISVFRSDSASRRAVLDHFASLASRITAQDQVVIYLVGHGSYDEHEYKFNITGSDLTDTDFRNALDSLPSEHQLLINTSSASGAIAELLQNDRRLLILATRSGTERHATRFGSYFVAALNDPTADLNKNQVVSADEAFQFADRQVDDFFSRNDRLATEHARMDGARADRFAIARLSARREPQSDPELLGMLRERDALNTEIDELRLARETMSVEEYQADLLQKLLELAALENDIEGREQSPGVENDRLADPER